MSQQLLQWTGAKWFLSTCEFNEKQRRIETSREKESSKSVGTLWCQEILIKFVWKICSGYNKQIACEWVVKNSDKKLRKYLIQNIYYGGVTNTTGIFYLLVTVDLVLTANRQTGYRVGWVGSGEYTVHIAKVSRLLKNRNFADYFAGCLF